MFSSPRRSDSPQQKEDRSTASGEIAIQDHDGVCFDEEMGVLGTLHHQKMTTSGISDDDLGTKYWTPEEEGVNHGEKGLAGDEKVTPNNLLIALRILKQPMVRQTVLYCDVI